MSDKPVAEMSFEEAIRELEAVVGRLEGGEVPLEDSIALYQRGSELRAKCDALLKAAEEKVAAITTDADGNATGTQPLDVG
ncbi:MAG: exodeoxyribonuclease VII small subunit [Vannielia sp.]|uniref:exodeoxyribonuclease VII small subunit n=1 Tax=Rhodobacterales TaxID=204455 RepID=UPI002095BEE0|nr:exodeoxyribonuclease VII small subunit [Oceanicola sp. 502str15]MCO6384281.1 exodeoxyribonuclease VII small subunit [Oceanicola sp. 502str15]